MAKTNYQLARKFTKEEGDLWVGSAYDSDRVFYTHESGNERIGDISVGVSSAPIAKLVRDDNGYRLFVKPWVMENKSLLDELSILHKGRKVKESTKRPRNWGSVVDFYSGRNIPQQTPETPEPRNITQIRDSPLFWDYKVPFVQSGKHKAYHISAIRNVLNRLNGVNGFSYQDRGTEQIIQFNGQERGRFSHIGKNYFISKGNFNLQQVADILQKPNKRDQEIFDRARFAAEKVKPKKGRMPTDELNSHVQALESRGLNPAFVARKRGIGKRKTDIYWNNYETPVETYKAIGLKGTESRNTKGTIDPDFLRQLEEDSRPEKVTVQKAIERRRELMQPKEPEEVFPDELEIQLEQLNDLYRELGDIDYLIVTRRPHEINIRKPNGGLAAAILDDKLIVNNPRERDKIMRIAMKYALVDEVEEDIA
jgi:hypothetical protein